MPEINWQLYHRKPWWKKFFYISHNTDEDYGYRWNDYVACIGPLQLRWRGKLERLNARN